MILDSLENAHNYYSIHSRFESAFLFIQKAISDMPALGKYEIDGEKVFAMVSHNDGRGKTKAVLEVHRQYIDIQVCAGGIEVIGWQYLQKCTRPKEAFNESIDCQLFSDRPKSWFFLYPQTFAVFFPYDAHAPLAGKGKTHKIVVKVKCA